MKIRFAKAPKPKRRPITKRRLAAAERFLQKERDKAPLFADAIAAEQPTAEDRITTHDDAFYAGWSENRVRRAQSWKRARWLLANLCERDRTILLDAWNRGRQPADPDCLLGHLSNFLRDSAQRFAEGERWFVFNPYDSKLVVLLWKPEHAPPTKIAGPFDDYLEAIDAMEKLQCSARP